VQGIRFVYGNATPGFGINQERVTRATRAYESRDSGVVMYVNYVYILSELFTHRVRFRDYIG